MFNFRVMRKHHRLILWIVVIAFAGSLSVWGALPRLGRGEKAEVEILGQKYMRADLARISFRRQRALGMESMTDEQLLSFLMTLEDAKRQGIVVPDEQVRSAGLGMLGVEGELPMSQYRMLVSQRMGLSEKMAVQEYEAALRDEITAKTLEYLMLGDVPVTEEEAYYAYLGQNEEIKLRYAGFVAEELGKEMEVGEAEIREWYEARRKEYLEPDQASVEYVSARSTKIEGNIEVSEEEIAEYYEENKGAYVEEPTSTEGDSAEEEAEVAYKPLEEVRESIEQIVRGRKAYEELNRRINEASLAIDAWYEAADADPENAPGRLDFEELAASHGLEYGRTGLFSEEEPALDIKRIQGAAVYATTHDKGDISPVLQGYSGKAILRVTERLPQRQLSLAEARESIVEAIRKEKGSEKGGLLAGEFAEKARELGWGAAVESIPAGVSGKVKFAETEFFPRPSMFSFRMQTIPGLGLKQAIVDALGRLKVGKVSEALEEEDGFYVVSITETKAAEAGEFDATREGLKSIIRQWRQLELVSAWQDSLEARVKVRHLTEAE